MARGKAAELQEFEVTELVGYARVSTREQHLDLQLDALRKAGVPDENIFVDKVSGWKSKRPGLEKTLKLLRPGWVLCVWKLDRLGRNLRNLLDLTGEFERRKVGLRSLTEQIDTTTAVGKLYFHMLAAFTEFERDVIRERSMAGSKLARERMEAEGRTWGRRIDPKLKKLLPAILKDAETMSFRWLSEKYKFPASTIQHYVRMRDIRGSKKVKRKKRMK